MKSSQARFGLEYKIVAVLAVFGLLAWNAVMGLHHDVGNFYPVSNSLEEAVSRGVLLYGKTHDIDLAGEPTRVEVMVEKAYSIPSKGLFWEQVDRRDSLAVIVFLTAGRVDSIDAEGGGGPHRCCFQVIADSSSRPRYVRIKTDTAWTTMRLNY